MGWFTKKTNLPGNNLKFDFKIEYDQMVNYSPQVSDLLEDIYFDAYKGKKGVVEKLIKLIKKYPHVPTLKNYLYVAYMKKGKTEEALKVMHNTVKMHPDYLFGKLNLSERYIIEGKIEKVLELLGENMDLKMLCPERDRFHISEVKSFLYVTALYFVEIGDMEQAGNRRDMLKKILPHDAAEPGLVTAKIVSKQLESGLRRIKEAQKREINVESFPTVTFSATTEQPVFNHPVIEILYDDSIDDIDVQLIDEILALPKESLIADLEKVLLDSIQRYKHFSRLFDEEDQIVDAPTHALYWLAGLKATESLDTVFNVLRQGEEYLDFWNGDFLESSFIFPIYYLGEQQLDKLKSFVLEPNLYSYARSIISEVVRNVAQHQPDRYKEVLDWYENVIDYHLENPGNKGIIDSIFLANIVADIVELRGVELIDKIEKIWENQWMTEMMIGDLEQIKATISKPANPSDVDPLPLNIYEFYSGEHEKRKAPASEEDKELTSDLLESEEFKMLTKMFNPGYHPNEDDYLDPYEHETVDAVEDFEEYEDDGGGTVFRKSPKVGRNDACPCGSGKKYKHCCLKK